MPKTYRVFVKDSGHINSTHEIEADSDEDAVKRARQFLSGPLRVEVWQDQRFVDRLDLAQKGEHKWTRTGKCISAYTP
jgi:hypothetical protein